MVRLNTVDPRAPNLSPNAVRVVGCQFLESRLPAAGTWDFDVKIPAYGVVLDVIVHAEEVWTAGTSATLNAGMYTVDADGVLSAEEDLDGIYAAIDMLATDLTKGQSLTFNRAGGKGGAMLTEGTSTHLLDIVGDTDRILRVNVTTVGTVTTALGETYVYVIYAVPELDAAVVDLT
jgi:hypothetical protein